MSADRWMVFLTLCFMCASAHDERHRAVFCEEDICETHILSAPLGSTVLLPCSLRNKNLSLVSWAQNPDMDLVNFTKGRYIQFSDPRHGRVNVFPNQHSEGNYSISIDDLKHSDLGCYRCGHGRDCVQVKLAAKQETQRLLIFICSGVAAFIVLIVGGYVCMKYTMCGNKRTEYNVNNPDGSDDNHLVYENDDSADHVDYPTRNHNHLPRGLRVVDRNAPTQALDLDPDQFNFVRTDSERTYISVIE